MGCDSQFDNEREDSYKRHERFIDAAGRIRARSTNDYTVGELMDMVRLTFHTSKYFGPNERDIEELETLARKPVPLL